MSYFTPPKIIDDNDATTFNQLDSTISNTVKATEVEKLEKFKSANGIIYLRKGTLRKDFIIKQEREGKWVNNQLFLSG